jgi:Alginate export
MNLKHSCSVAAAGAAILVTCYSSAFAGGPPPPAITLQKPPEASPLCFANGELCFDVQERLRFEARENNFDFDDSVDSVTDDSFLLSRFRIGAAFKPVDWLKFYVQGQDSREFFSQRPNIPGALGAEGDDTFDLRQGYVQLGPKEWNLTAGRQVLAYGDERLIGPSDWNNFSRTFDAAKLHFEASKTTSIDLFASTLVVIDRHSFNQSDLFNGDELHRDLVFSGIYFTTGAIEPVTLDLYVLGLDQARGNNANLEGALFLLPAGAAGGNFNDRTDFATLGTRIKADPKKLSGFEFEGEFALQAGTVADLDLFAGAVHVGGGYNFVDCPWKPRIFLEYNFASGDDDPTDGDDGTFQNLFPTAHKFYGFMDLFGWQNIHNPALDFRVKPHEKFTVDVWTNAFWLVTTNDSLYRKNGLSRVRPLTPLAQSADNYAGTEIDLTFTFQPIKPLAFQVGYSHFFAGDYLSDTGAGDDADFGYVQAMVTF